MSVHLTAEHARVAYVKEFLLFKVLFIFLAALRTAEDIVVACDQ
jgi:hypothetical protein